MRKTILFLVVLSFLESLALGQNIDGKPFSNASDDSGQPVENNNPPNATDSRWVGNKIIFKERSIDLFKSPLSGEYIEKIALRGAVYTVVEEFGPWVCIREKGQGRPEIWLMRENAVLLSEATDYFAKRIEANPADSFAYFARAESFLHKKELDKALKDLAEAVRLDPNHNDVRNVYGAVYAAKGDYDQALEQFNQVLGREAENVDALTTRGVILLKRQDLDRALADFSKALQSEPDCLTALKGQCMIFASRSDWEGALADIEQILLLDPGDYKILALRGKIRHSQGKLDLALGDLTEALRANPRWVVALLDRAEVYNAMKQPDKAIADCDRAIDIDSGCASAYIHRAAIRVNSTEEWDLIVADLDQVLKLDPNNTKVASLRKHVVNLTELLQVGQEN
jgi:tetratricopeptide (TPR) repeat protein